MSGYGAYIGPQNPTRNGDNANERRLEAARRRYSEFSEGFPAESPTESLSGGTFHLEAAGDLRIETHSDPAELWPMAMLEEPAELAPAHQNGRLAQPPQNRNAQPSPWQNAQPRPMMEPEGYALPGPMQSAPALAMAFPPGIMQPMQNQPMQVQPMQNRSIQNQPQPNLPPPMRSGQNRSPRPMNTAPAQSRQGMLNRVSMQDFEVLELALYLDTHPADTHALGLYHAAAERARALRAEFEASYGPLTHLGVESTTHWTWSDDPWPWDTTEREESRNVDL